MNIAVLGAQGFVGTEIVKALQNSPENINIIPVVRGDEWEAKLGPADIIIHSANSGRRFFAENNPEDDYTETVLKTQKLVDLSKGKKIVLISSLSARTQLYTVYGRNRRTCELLVAATDGLIVRLGPMYGGSKSAGALYDLVQGKKVYLSEKTRYSYVPVSYNAEKIVKALNQTGLMELGARNSIDLAELAAKLKSTSSFEGVDDTQVPLTTDLDAPDAYDVVNFGLELIKNLKLEV